MAKIIDLDHDNSLSLIKKTLAEGGLIAYPTDTFYGIGADPFNSEAVSKIFKIKNRSAGKPILVLVSSLDQLKLLTPKISALSQKAMAAFWPGPLTLLFDAQPTLPNALTAGSGKIGVRFPSHAITLKLIEGIGHPLTASSANLSGEDNPETAGEVELSLGPNLDLILDGGRTKGLLPSTVLDSTDSPPRIVREGAVLRAKIESVLECACN